MSKIDAPTSDSLQAKVVEKNANATHMHHEENRRSVIFFSSKPRENPFRPSSNKCTCQGRLQAVLHVDFPITCPQVLSSSTPLLLMIQLQALARVSIRNFGTRTFHFAIPYIRTRALKHNYSRGHYKKAVKHTVLVCFGAFLW